MAKSYWLVKQEPNTYSWDTFVKDGGTAWTGVRNFQARNYLRAMKAGDLVLFYHSGADKQAVGLARVKREAYSDPSATEGDWSAVDLIPIKPLKSRVSLQSIRADKHFEEMLLLRNSRLSVSPVAKPQFDHLMTLAQTKP